MRLGVFACLLMLVPDACEQARPSYGFKVEPVKPESGMLTRVVIVTGVQCNTPAAKYVRIGDQILTLNGIRVPDASRQRHNQALDILKSPKEPIEGKILRIRGAHRSLIDFKFEAALTKGSYVNPEKDC